MIKPLTNREINNKLQKLRREVLDLRDVMFKWGQRDSKEIDDVRAWVLDFCKLNKAKVDINFPKQKLSEAGGK